MARNRCCAAAEKDAGFDPYVLTQMLVRAEDRPDADFPVPAEELGDLRAWSRAWRVRLANELLP